VLETKTAEHWGTHPWADAIPGTCFKLQVGVNAPGTARSTTFLPLHNCKSKWGPGKSCFYFFEKLCQLHVRRLQQPRTVLGEPLLPTASVLVSFMLPSSKYLKLACGNLSPTLMAFGVVAKDLLNAARCSPLHSTGGVSKQESKVRATR
jgi:hypothetical protein